MSASQRTKGAAAERELRTVLRDLLGENAVSERRLEQTRDGGHDLDVGGMVALEVKRQERASLHVWLEQAEAGAPDDRLPAVAWRPSRRDWVVAMAVEDWAELVRETLR